MNERIRLLAEQAFFDESTSRPSTKMYTFSDHKMEKFAELIVRECIEKSLEERIDPDLIEQEQDIEDRCYLRGSNSGIIDAVCAIKQHFGVEE